ncbi:hypothetical protein V6N11_009185 [Hibiscus sabdariffa]|uniref:Uncharacterized protein n=1 Tax=Hibiscus sabdariffa TaxID=183260 RepID=A0ABR2PPW0_9ROSI
MKTGKKSESRNHSTCFFLSLKSGGFSITLGVSWNQLEHSQTSFFHPYGGAFKHHKSTLYSESLLAMQILQKSHRRLSRQRWPYEPNVDGMLCRAGDNVRTDDKLSPRFQYRKPVVGVSCNGCNKHIGERFVVPNPPDQGAFEGWYLFHLDRILYSDGTHLRYADTHQVAVSDE